MPDHGDEPEYEVDIEEAGEIGDVAWPLPIWARVANHGAFRRAVVLVLLAVSWELAARWSDNPLMLPSFTETMSAWWGVTISGELPQPGCQGAMTR